MGNVLYSAEVNWLKEDYRSKSAVDVLDGKAKIIMQEFHGQLTITNSTLSAGDWDAQKMALGGIFIACL